MTDEEYVQKYGEKYRKLIMSGLKWLRENEPKWNLKKPTNKDRFIKDLISRSK